jgi:hypothetical protein
VRKALAFSSKSPRVRLLTDIGARLFQEVFISTNEDTGYFSEVRKYSRQVLPEPSAALLDEDLIILNEIWLKANHFK